MRRCVRLEVTGRFATTLCGTLSTGFCWLQASTQSWKGRASSCRCAQKMLTKAHVALQTFICLIGPQDSQPHLTLLLQHLSGKPPYVRLQNVHWLLHPITLRRSARTLTLLLFAKPAASHSYRWWWSPLALGLRALPRCSSNLLAPLQLDQGGRPKSSQGAFGRLRSGGAPLQSPRCSEAGC